VDLSVFHPASSSQARKQLRIPEDAFVVMFAAQSVRSNPFKDYATIRRAAEIVAATKPIWLLAVGEPGADEVAGLFELALMGHIHPQPAENALLLELEHGRVGVSAAVHVVWPYQASDFVGCRKRDSLFHVIFRAKQLNSIGCRRLPMRV
jgi:hypothetical protein